jgi:hypothetical protein
MDKPGRIYNADENERNFLVLSGQKRKISLNSILKLHVLILCFIPQIIWPKAYIPEIIYFLVLM